MGAAANQGLRAQQLSGHRRGQIPLAQMHAISLHRQGDVDAVVDDEQGPMARAELPQAAGLEQPLAVVEGTAFALNEADLSAFLGPVLHQPYPHPQGRLHRGFHLGPWATHQIQVALGQELAPLLAAAGCLEQIHLQVVEAVAQGRRFAGQFAIQAATKFLQHPQGLMHPARIGTHHLGWAEALQLGGMAHARRRIGGAVARQFVVVAVEPPQPLAHVLGAGHQIGAIQAKAGPILQHPQPFAGPIEVGIQQPGNSELIGVGVICRTHGVTAQAD